MLDGLGMVWGKGGGPQAGVWCQLTIPHMFIIYWPTNKRVLSGSNLLKNSLPWFREVFKRVMRGKTGIFLYFVSNSDFT